MVGSTRLITLQSSETPDGVELKDSYGYKVISDKPDELLTFLAKHASLNSFIVTWDLNRFLKPLFKVLPVDVVRTLNNGERAKWPPFKLFYGVGKGRFFGVDFKEREHIKANFYREDKYEATIYQLSTWYPGEQSLTIEDTQAKAVKLLATLGRMGMEPQTLTSPASVFEQSVLRKMPMPTILTMPESAFPFHEFAANYIREWRSAYKIGVWETGCRDYDLSGAYSSVIAELPNLNSCELIHTDGDIPSNAAWGLMKGTLNMTATVHPLPDADGLCRQGVYDDIIALPELDCISRWGMGTFKPREGWFIRVRARRELFKYTMQRLYQFRNGKDSLSDDIAKSMSNSLWGKFHQMIGEKYGEFVNFIYASWVASEARIRVCDFIYANHLQDDLVSVTVDGCLATKTLNIPTERRFGQWRINPEGAALVLSANHQWYGDKRPNGRTAAEMIADIKAHPRSAMLGDIPLQTIDHDRYFERLPKNGRDLLQNTYCSKPFVAPTEIGENTPAID
jgi:hypothetical protein